jgi:2'-5' RNA ligase
MARQGFRHLSSHYTPHMTLLYDPRYLAAREVTPVEWTAREFVLIHSLIGKARYEVLGRWPLNGG